jgi:hypothetical protein
MWLLLIGFILTSTSCPFEVPLALLLYLRGSVVTSKVTNQLQRDLNQDYLYLHILQI